MANERKRNASPAAGPSRNRKTLVLSAEAIQRLGAASVRECCDESAIVEKLINEHLAGYVIQVRGPRLVIAEDRRASAGDANPAVTSAA